MAIREKLKAKFSSKNKTSSSGNSTPSESSSSSTPGHYTGRTDIEYYKPNEIPKSKYRGRVDPAHKDLLEAYSMGDAFQTIRKQTSGTFSPGGTKAFSRRTSYNSAAGTRTPGGSSSISLASNDGGSFSVPSSESDSPHIRSIAAAMTPNEPMVRENSNDDTDVTNTGLSRVGTAPDTRPHHTKDNIPTIQLDRQATVTKDNGISNSHIEHSQLPNDIPFSADELTQAITRATITAH